MPETTSAPREPWPKSGTSGGHREELREAMREAAARGASLREIGEVVGLSHTGVAKWLAEEGKDE